MNLNYKAIVNITGGILIVFSICFILPAIVSLIYSEKSNAIIFFAVAVFVFLAGALLKALIKPDDTHLRIRDGFFVVSLIWILIPLIGAAPLTLSGDMPSYIDAVFESCSGFSTTGSTVLTDIEAMSQGMLFWRSFTHWLGGIGILILAIAVIPMLYSGKQNIALESTGPSFDKTSSKLSDSARQLYILYFSFTLLQIILLMFGGMNLFDASIHTFGSVGTGGFSNYNDSVAHFDSLYIEIVIIVFMFLCGINFNLFFTGFRQGIKSFIGNPEFKLYLIITCTISVLIGLTLVFSGSYSNPGKAFTDSVFQVVSVITTTGFFTADYDIWPQFARALIFLLFFIGGCASSTAGGIKVFRILVLLKLVKRSIGTRLHPNAVIKIKIKGSSISNDLVSNVASFTFLYLCLIAAGSVLVSLDGYDMITTISAVMTCLGNIGPGFNLTGPVMNFDIFSGWAKGVLSFLMIAGRLELFTFLAFFTPHFWNSDRY